MTSQTLLPLDLLGRTRNRWDLAVEGLLATLLAFMPLAFGAVDAWSELIVAALAAALTLVVLVRAAVDRTFQLPWTWAYVPLGLFLLLIVVQLTPWPNAWVAAVSPASASTRSTFLGDQASAGAMSTISLVPLATAHGLRLALVGAAVFFATFSVFRTAPQIRRLLAIVFVIGCAEAALALLQIVTDAHLIYWTIDAGPQRLTSGSFINYSNFSQFINLSIGAGVALLLVKLVDDGSPRSRRDDPSRPFGGTRLSDHGALLAGVILSAVAVFASMSRNGVISLIAAATIVGLALYARGTLRRRGWVLALLPIGALAVLLVFGFDAIYDRIATLHERDQLVGRWDMTLGALRAWRDYPVWGAGLGSHEFVFPMYDASINASVAAHADNDYVQLLEETGVAGAACVAAFLAMIGARLAHACWRGRSTISTAAFGLALGLIAVAIHSATDFGQHVPAVFCLSAVTCALAVRIGRHEASSRNKRANARRTILWRRGGAAFAALGGALAWGWVLTEAYAAHVGEQWWAAALQVDDEIRQNPAVASDQQYADLLAASEQAVASQPQNVTYRYWLNAYRWQSLARNVDPNTGQALLEPAAKPLVARISDDLAATRAICPTFGPPYGLEGQLRLFVLDDAAGRDLIRKGVRLAPNDPPTCLIAGELTAREGRADEAMELLRRAARLAPGMYADVAAVALDVLHRPEFARELAGDDYPRLDQLARVACAREDQSDFAEQIRRDAEASLRRRATDDKASAGELAQLAALDASREHFAAAAEFYRRALALDYDQVEWRLARAQALAAAGDQSQAMREVRTCLSLQPGHAAARQLAEELSLRIED